jgi:hypothetical protein
MGDFLPEATPIPLFRGLKKLQNVSFVTLNENPEQRRLKSVSTRTKKPLIWGFFSIPQIHIVDVDGSLAR